MAAAVADSTAAVAAVAFTAVAVADAVINSAHRPLEGCGFGETYEASATVMVADRSASRRNANRRSASWRWANLHASRAFTAWQIQ
jgi:hypothetical protein